MQFRINGVIGVLSAVAAMVCVGLSGAQTAAASVSPPVACTGIYSGAGEALAEDGSYICGTTAGTDQAASDVPEPAANGDTSGSQAVPDTIYSLPKSGTSHPDGVHNDIAYEFVYKGSHEVCVKVNGTYGGTKTTKVILYFDLFRYAGNYWDSQGRTKFYFALDGANHYACWTSGLYNGNDYAVIWMQMRYAYNGSKGHLSYTEYYGTHSRT